MSQEIKQKMISNILNGNFPQVEREMYAIKQNEATLELQKILEQVTNSQQGRQIARQLQQKYGYRDMKRVKVSITTMVGDVIKITSWYALKQGKKLGKFKKGRNGRGIHLLLKYWGFIGKNSFNYETRVARTGVACTSYDLAGKELEEQGFSIHKDTVNNITQKVGETAADHRKSIALEPDENFKDKRIMIAIDGGRIRTRQAKTGRYSKEQKLAKYSSSWREPKLLVIAELDEQGQKKKGTKPIYEATMNNHDEIFKLLENIARKCNIQEAKEIILSGDGAPWIWNKFKEFRIKFKISHKTTEILDFYHACEHLTEISEANTSLKSKEQKEWLSHLKELLKSGKFQQLKRNIVKESKKKKLSSLLDPWQYFERNKTRLKYNIYRKNKQPIGSGIVESAIRRVINLKLKSPSSFWKIDNLEKMLQLRCIFMADRWNIFKQNLLKVSQFTV